MSSLGSFGSISGHGAKKPEPIPLTFSASFGEGSIFKWYHGLTDSRAKLIQTLQIRKDVTGPVPHRFIVLRMCDNHVHRFDRRPDHNDVDASVVGLLANRAVASQDSYVLNISLPEEEKRSQCEIELILGGQVNLLAVISACYAISNDGFAGKYTFLRHNCFFFSWTILMVVSRHYLPYDIPKYDSIMNRFRSQLGRLTSFIVNEAIALFLDLVIDTVTIFREMGGKEFGLGMNTVGRIAWALPVGVHRFLWRQMFTVRLHLGLRGQLTKTVKALLLARLGSISKAVLSVHMAPEMLDAHLWIEGAQEAVENGLKTEISKILWETVLEAISSGLGNVELEQLSEQVTDPRLKPSLLGLNGAQLCAVWNAALHGGLPAVRGVAHGLGGLPHEEAFDRAWFAARDPALKAAQTVVKNTSAQLNNPKRDEMWVAIFKIWNDCWEKAGKMAQPRSVQVVEKIAKELIATGSGVVIEDMRESKVKTIQAHMLKASHFIHIDRGLKV